jgi:hypothetical protein
MLQAIRLSLENQDNNRAIFLIAAALASSFVFFAFTSAWLLWQKTTSLN